LLRQDAGQQIVRTTWAPSPLKGGARFSPGAFLLFLFIVSGCTGPSQTDHHIALESAYEGTPLVAATEMSVGIHYDDALFREEVSLDVREGQDLERYLFIPGPRTAELFDRIFAALFRHLRRVAERPPLAEDGGDLDGVLEVRLEHVSSHKMDYRLTLFELTGRQIYEWRAEGRLARKVENVGDAVRGVQTAMRDAAAQFLVEFRDPPQVQWWLLEPGSAFEDAPPPAGPF
jgi:hypothetical protein